MSPWPEPPRPSPALPGRTRYEMKWDGLRIAAVRTDEHTALWSRRGVRLDSQFPDLMAAAAEQLPAGVVIDGEAVIWQDGRLDFSALLSRMGTSASSARRLALQKSASLVAFDLLLVARHDVRDRALAQRRQLLEELSESMTPPLRLPPSPKTSRSPWLVHRHGHGGNRRHRGQGRCSALPAPASGTG